MSKTLSIAAILIGLYLIWSSGNDAYTLVNNPEWATTEGVVLSSRTEYSRQKTSRRDYRLDIRYTYTVNGKRFETSRITGSYGTGFRGTKREIDNLVRTRFAEGQSITVYYPPTNPEIAHLKPDRNAIMAYAWVSAGIGLLLIGLFFLGRGLWRFYLNFRAR